MKRTSLAAAAFAICLGLTLPLPGGLRAAEATKLTFVLVHGATAGGWEWKSTGKHLLAGGHTVYRATLTGLGERMHLNSTNVDLQDSVNDRNQPVAAR